MSVLPVDSLDARLAARIFGPLARLRGRYRLYLALDGLTGFSTALLRLASIFGLAASFLSFVLLCVVLVKKVFFSIPIPGFTMLAAGLFFIGGTILLSLGILGEYVAKTFRQVQGRPLYVVSEESDPGS